MRIMVADDSLFMRKIIRAMLEQAGHQVIGEASDGRKAICQYTNLSPDLVIMDITMPVLSGLASLKEILSHDPDAKVIMCSAMGQETIINECIECGAKGFIIKPLTIELLLKEITKLSVGA